MSTISLFHLQQARGRWQPFGPSNADLQNKRFALRQLSCHENGTHFVYANNSLATIPPFAVQFSEDGERLAIGYEDGRVSLISRCQTPSYRPDPEHIWAHDNAVFDVRFVHGTNQFITASGDQSCRLFDAASHKPVVTFHGHAGSVKTVRSSPYSPHIFVSGARDGHIMMWDSRCPDLTDNEGHAASIPAVAIRNAHTRTVESAKMLAISSRQSVTCVEFLDSEHFLVSAGAQDGVIKLWDARYIRPKQESPVLQLVQLSQKGDVKHHGITSMAISSSRMEILANCSDNRVYRFNLHAENPQLSTYTGHQNRSFYVRIAYSPDDKFFISGSSDSNAYIWEVDNPRAPPVKLCGSMREVGQVDWHPTDFATVAIGSDDGVTAEWSLEHAHNPDMPWHTEEGIASPMTDECATIWHPASTDEERIALQRKKQKQLRVRTLDELWAAKRESSPAKKPRVVETVVAPIPSKDKVGGDVTKPQKIDSVPVSNVKGSPARMLDGSRASTLS